MALLLTLALIPYPFTGCASSPIDFAETETIPERHAVVFGRIKVVSKGESITWASTEFGRTSGFGPGEFRVHILPETASEAIAHFLSGDGSFYWHLPPGRYSIADFSWGRPELLGATSQRGRIFAQFAVQVPGSVVYIGTLTLIFEGGAVPCARRR